MNEQQELMKRASEAYEQINQEKDGERFFAWLEETFGIENYKKEFQDSYHIAKVNDIGFLWVESAPMSAALFANCLFCKKERFTQKIGTITTLEELGAFIERGTDGTLYFDCGKHFSSHIDKRKQDTFIEEEITFAEPEEAQKLKTVEKREVVIYFSDENYDL